MNKRTNKTAKKTFSSNSFSEINGNVKLGSQNQTPTASRKSLTIGQRAADSLTKTMGSWYFIILFMSYLATWIGFNVYAFWHSWDPYPFILLNLTLSCLAALQAPIILMSQNRSSERDRIRFEYDYAVNRKAEREIQDMQKDLDDIKKMLTKFNK